jgi:hypothetical protein
MAVELPDIDFCLEYIPARDQSADARPHYIPKKRRCTGCKKFSRLGSFMALGYIFKKCRQCRERKL